MTVDVGDVIAEKYRLTGLLGSGGMGKVFSGVNETVGRQVAIKVMIGSLVSSADLVERFEMEARAAAQISSEHVAEVYDAGALPTGERYMVMEFLDGESLSARLARMGPMAPEAIFPIMVQLLEGLACAHEAGIVHRDLKPANIFLVRGRRGYDDFVKILDFGVSKFSALGRDDGVTRTGEIVGTPRYLAPELTRGARHADHRSDQYSVAAIMYRALSGRPPVTGETIHEVLTQLISDTPPRLEKLVSDLDAQAAEIVHRALSRKPRDRYDCTEDLLAALTAWLDRRGIVVHPVSHSGGHIRVSSKTAASVLSPPAIDALARTAEPQPQDQTETVPRRARPATVTRVEGRGTIAEATTLANKPVAPSEVSSSSIFAASTQRQTSTAQRRLTGIGVAASVAALAIGGLLFAVRDQGTSQGAPDTRSVPGPGPPTGEAEQGPSGEPAPADLAPSSPKVVSSTPAPSSSSAGSSASVATAASSAPAHATAPRPVSPARPIPESDPYEAPEKPATTPWHIPDKAPEAAGF